ncbi:unnamed protein product [Cunninghamella echinulata]
MVISVLNVKESFIYTKVGETSTLYELHDPVDLECYRLISATKIENSTNRVVTIYSTAGCEEELVKIKPGDGESFDENKSSCFVVVADS